MERVGEQQRDGNVRDPPPLLKFEEQAIVMQANRGFFASVESKPAATGHVDEPIELALSEPTRIATYLSTKAEFGSSNRWPKSRRGKNMRQKAFRSCMHGVEIRTLPDEHFLAGDA